MHALIITTHRFKKDRTGIYATSKNLGLDFFREYLDIFDRLTICGRVETVDAVHQGERIEHPQIAFSPLPCLRHWKWFLARWGPCRTILQSEVQATDVVISRDASFFAEIAQKEARRLGRPYMTELLADPREIFRSYGNSFPIRAIASWQAAKTAKIVRRSDVVSYVNRTTLPERYPARPGAPQDCISDIRLEDDALAEARVYAERPNPIRLLCVAAMVPFKRHEDILHAAEELRRRGLSFELHFLGDGHLRARLEHLIAQRNLENNVFFHGFVYETERIQKIVDSCDLSLLASNSAEGMPRAMIETMARGLGGIASDAGGLKELVRPEELFPIGDVDALARILYEAATDPARLTTMSTHAIRTASEFTRSKLRPKRLELYRRLAALLRHEN